MALRLSANLTGRVSSAQGPLHLFLIFSIRLDIVLSRLQFDDHKCLPPYIPIFHNTRFWLVLQGMATATCLFHPSMWRLCIYSNFLQAPKRSKALWTAQNSFTFIQRVRSLMGAWSPTRRCWSVTMDQLTLQKSSPPDWTRAGESHSYKTLF